MKYRFFIFLVSIFCQHISAQKVIYYPNYENKNFNVELTKIEITDKETILHFYTNMIGSFFIIPSITHIIEASGKGEKLFIRKAVGLNLSERNYVNNQSGMKYKLYFPPLSDHITQINYGEHGSGEANWSITKIDISNNKTHFYKTFEKNDFGSYKTVAYPKGVIDSTLIKNNEKKPIAIKDMPKAFFGTWHDTYGSLKLITTPEYFILDFKIYYYRDIFKTGDNKFLINTTGGDINIFNLTEEKMTLRADKMMNLNKSSKTIKVPAFLKGNWVHRLGVKKITITDAYFYNDDTALPQVNEVENNRIVFIASSKAQDEFWFVLQSKNKLHAFKADKKEEEYIITPSGFVSAIYKKVKN